MRASGVCLSVVCLAVACGGAGADRPDGRPGPAGDAGLPPPDAGLPDGGASDGGILGTIGPLGETSWTLLLDASLSSFYRWMPSRGRNKDPDGIFQMDGGVLHVLGIPPTDEQVDFGYLATLDDVGDYRARVEQKWGTNTFAPRLDQPRDTGLLYHVRGVDQLWPQCVEFQIMEHNTGDLWVLSGTAVTVPVADPSAAEPSFNPLGESYNLSNGRVIKWWEAESHTDWNTIELIASGQQSAQIVNGQWLNGATDIVAGDGDGGWEPLTHGHLALQAEGAETFYRSFEIRPLAYLPPPDGGVVLFDGSNVDAWQGPDGGTPGWNLVDGALEVVPGSGDLRTREAFGDVRLHLEFQVPPTPSGTDEQDRGNSGVYLQSRYEVQILDTFGHQLADANDCGAIYGVKDATVNEAFPPGIWQSYDIVFHAATWNGTTKESPARVTVVWNGSVVQQDTEVQDSTRLGEPEAPGPAPLRLQDHSNRVRFRNIWLQPLPDAGIPDGGPPDGGAPDAGP
jgi:hypothetical protein